MTNSVQNNMTRQSFYGDMALRKNGFPRRTVPQRIVGLSGLGSATSNDLNPQHATQQVPADATPAWVSSNSDGDLFFHDQSGTVFAAENVYGEAIPVQNAADVVSRLNWLPYALGAIVILLAFNSKR